MLWYWKNTREWRQRSLCYKFSLASYEINPYIDSPLERHSCQNLYDSHLFFLLFNKDFIIFTHFSHIDASYPVINDVAHLFPVAAPVCGTLCRGMSRRRRHWLSSGNASRLASSIVPYPKCPVVPAQWFVMSDTIMNVLFTYLLHAIPTYTIFKSIWFFSAQLWRNRSNLTRCTLYRCTLLLRIQ